MRGPCESADFEFRKYAEGFIPDSCFEQATKGLSHYFVSFGVDDRPSGSATLLDVDGQYGFLTAAHVVDDWFRSTTRCIAVVCSAQLHRLLLDKQHIEITRYGPSKDPFAGPDLAFVRLYDTKCIGTLKATKSFYPLSISYRPKFFEKIQPPACAVCFVGGAPAEMSKEEGVRRSPSHILGSTHFFGRAQVSDEFFSSGFDYLKFDMIAGHSGFPSDYRGVSGGGVWHVPFALDPDVGASSLKIERPELIGVAFCQSDLSDNSRTIFAHGIKSVHSAVRSYPSSTIAPVPS